MTHTKRITFFSLDLPTSLDPYKKGTQHVTHTTPTTHRAQIMQFQCPFTRLTTSALASILNPWQDLEATCYSIVCMNRRRQVLLTIWMILAWDFKKCGKRSGVPIHCRSNLLCNLVGRSSERAKRGCMWMMSGQVNRRVKKKSLVNTYVLIDEKDRNILALRKFLKCGFDRGYLCL